LVMDVLAHLETERGNSPRTRHARLAAIKAFMTCVEYGVLSSLAQSRRLRAMPPKKTARPRGHPLSMAEMPAILEAPDRRTRPGRRDRAMIPLCCAVALRVSALLPFPLTACPCHPTPTVQSQGKGRRARALPLWKQAADELRAWLAVRGLLTVPDVFLSAPGRPMTRMGFTHRLHQEKERAATHGPSLTETHGPPHVLRHPWAMVILQATGGPPQGLAVVGTCGYANDGRLSPSRSHGEAGSP
jgi:integrase/recombinase XerD